MHSFFLFNFIVMLLQILFFVCTYSIFKNIFQDDSEGIEHEVWWILLICLTLFFFIIATVLFWLVSKRDAGSTQGIKKSLFYIILDRAIKEQRNLDYFCFFCRTLWSSSGVHCMTCGTCVEGFDHHCSFVNNCIGYKNHARFMNFLGVGLLYTISQICTLAMVLYQNNKHCH